MKGVWYCINYTRVILMTYSIGIKVVIQTGSTNLSELQTTRNYIMTQGSNRTLDSQNNQGSMGTIHLLSNPSSRQDSALATTDENSEQCDSGKVQPMPVKGFPVLPSSPCIIL